MPLVSSSEIDRKLEEVRLSLLRGCRILAVLGSLLLVAALVQGRARGHDVRALIIELAIFFGATAALFFVRKRGARAGGIVLVASFLPVSLAALFQFGPLMGTGVMFLLWVLFAAFFLDAIVVPALVLPSALLACGWLIESGQLAVPWPRMHDGLAGWSRWSHPFGDRRSRLAPRFSTSCEA